MKAKMATVSVIAVVGMRMATTTMLMAVRRWGRAQFALSAATLLPTKMMTVLEVDLPRPTIAMTVMKRVTRLRSVGQPCGRQHRMRRKRRGEGFAIFRICGAMQWAEPACLFLHHPLRPHLLPLQSPPLRRYRRLSGEPQQR